MIPERDPGLLDPGEAEELRAQALDVLREVIDPEIGLSIVELGLVYGVDVDGKDLRVRLTMTTPACPLGDHIVRDAETRLGAIEGVTPYVELVWEPPWTPEKMSPTAKDMLGWNVR